MADIRIRQLPDGGGPVATDYVPIDNGTTRRATVQQIAEVGRPVASQAEAEAGTNPSKAMTPLTTAQAVDFYGLTKAGNLAGLANAATARTNLGLGSAAVEDVSAFATSAQGTKADTAWQPTTGTDSFGASINSSRIYGRVRDHVSILDYATSVSARDNIKNGSTAFNASFDDAADDAVARGIKVVNFTDGNFELDDDTFLDNPGVYVRGEPGGTKLYKNGAGRMFQTLGTAPNTSTDGYALTANAASGATSVTMSTANAANFTAGTRAIVWQNIATSGNAARDAEFVWITNVNTGTGVITFAAPIYFAYTTANTAKLFNVTLIEGVGYENLIIDWTDGTQTSPQRPPYNVDEVIASWFCLKPRFSNVASINTINATLNFHGCVDAYVANLRGQNGKSDATDLTDAYSYGIAESGLNVGLVANGLQFERHRHAYTTGAADSADPTMFNGGHPFWSVVANGVHRWAKAAGWDSHDTGVGITFQNLHTVGGVQSGFQIRDIKHRIINCSARDIQLFSGSQGYGLFLAGQDSAGLWCRDAEIDGFSAYNCAGAGIRDQAPGTIARNIRIELAQGPAIHWDGGASGDGEYSDIYAKDVAKNAALGGAYAVVVGNASAQKNPRIRDMFVDDPNNNLTALVRRNNVATDKVELTNVRGLNSAKAAIDVFFDPSSTDNVMIRGGYGPSGESNGPIKTITIASDSINVNTIFAAGVLLLPETSTTDTLITVVGGERDAVLELWGSSGNTITLQHGTGTDNLVLKGAVNVNVLANQVARFRRRGATWIEIGRNF